MMKTIFTRLDHIARSARHRRGHEAILGYLLLVVIVAIGSIVGLVNIRDQFVQEYGDLSVGLESLDQSYSINVELDLLGTTIPIVSGGYIDTPLPILDGDGDGTPPGGIMFVPLDPSVDDPEAPLPIVP